MKGRLPAAVLSLVLTLACSGTPAPSLPSRPSPTRVQPSAAPSLQERITALLADPAVAAGVWGVEVRSLATRDTVFASNPHRLLTPASTLKTITLAVAADQLGWDYTYETKVSTHGPIENGTLDGDLVVVGSGDPSFDDWDGAATAVFQSWATKLKALGITSIGGRIVGNDDAFTDEGLGAGWMWDDLAFAYSAPASGLQFNEGSVQVIVTPGESAGEPAILALSPSHARVPLMNEVRTGRAGVGTVLSVNSLPRSPGARLKGTIAVDAGRQVRTISVGNPTLYFANAVRTGLLAGGVEVFGGAVDADDLVDPPSVDEGRNLATYRSSPLATLAGTLMKLSQNLYAESLLRTLGRTQGGAGTADSGIEVIHRVLASWGIPESEVLMADGSGLSRYNLVTADAMVSVLAHVYDDARLRDPYVASLPVAGLAGTLSTRMKGTAAEGNVQAKTGSFTNARAVAGFVRAADGEPLAFTIIANNYGVPPAQIDRVTDGIIVALAESSR